MRSIVLLLALAGALLQASPAFAWWEYAKWGMTAEQLTRASKGAVRACDQNATACKPLFTDYRPALYALDLQVAGFPAAAQFALDPQGKLNATYIDFRDANFDRLNEALLSVYGQPIEVNNRWPPWRAWRDAAKGTLVRIWNFPESRKIVIEYKPATKGL